MNLLVEVTRTMERLGKISGDIVFIGSIATGHTCTWTEFKRLADVEYHKYEGSKVAVDLEIVFNDGHVLNCSTLHQLDNSIDLELVSLLTPSKPKPITSIIVEEDWGDGEHLIDINDKVSA